MKCFYHSADLDGHCSGAIIRNTFPSCECIGVDYSGVFQWDRLTPSEVVYMVDFSLPLEDMRRLNELVELHWIDHHKSAIDAAHAAGFLASGGQLLEIGRAGCELTWEYLYRALHLPEEMPDSVRLLGRYDVWDHSDKDVLPFQYGLRIEKNTLPESPIWPTVLCDANIDWIIKRGQVILDYEEAQNRKYAGLCFETELNGLKAIAVNRLLCNSRTFDYAFDPIRHGHTIMITFGWNGENWKVSLYSDHDSDIDVSELAKVYGGGGHKHAAGFSCAHLPFSHAA